MRVEVRARMKVMVMVMVKVRTGFGRRTPRTSHVARRRGPMRAVARHSVSHTHVATASAGPTGAATILQY